MKKHWTLYDGSLRNAKLGKLIAISFDSGKLRIIEGQGHHIAKKW
jgi:hypothetical protein